MKCVDPFEETESAAAVSAQFQTGAQSDRGSETEASLEAGERCYAPAGESSLATRPNSASAISATRTKPAAAARRRRHPAGKTSSGEATACDVAPVASKPRDQGYGVLPEHGFVRVPKILQVYPISRSGWWAGVADGTLPSGFLLSSRVRAWAVEDIRRLIAEAKHAA